MTKYTPEQLQTLIDNKDAAIRNMDRLIETVERLEGEIERLKKENDDLLAIATALAKHDEQDKGPKPMDNKYNGWTNYETWLVNLWIGDLLQQDADEGIAITGEYIRDLVDTFAEPAFKAIGNYGLIVDLLNGAIGAANYYEIARHYEVNESEE